MKKLGGKYERNSKRLTQVGFVQLQGQQNIGGQDFRPCLTKEKGDLSLEKIR